MRVARRRFLRTVVTVTAVVVVVILVATTLGVTALVRRPLPQVSGALTLPGLEAEVTVTRDARGVPSIRATTARDLFMAQGFTHAQDRFFEMDYRRHVTAGRMSELVGANEAALEADKVIRTFGWRRIAEQEWELVSQETREYLQSYADGVNAYLATRSAQALGIEYTVLGLQVQVAEPEPWDPIDSLAWLKAMAWDLRGNFDEELARAQSYAALRDVDRVDELFPAYPEQLNAPIVAPATTASAQRLAVDDGAMSPSVDDGSTFPSADDGAMSPSADDGAVDDASPSADDGASIDALLGDPALDRAIEAAQRALDAVPALVGHGEGVGSNSFVVAGEHTASGLPLLANDPHLGISAPGIWAQQSLRCATVGPLCPFDVSGFTFAGLPGVIIGHNADLAWGLTNLGADVTDFFVERVTSDGGFLYDDEVLPLEVRNETILVNGGEPVEIEVRSTVHGPIVSDVFDSMDAVERIPVQRPSVVTPASFAVSLAWTALTPGRTADAVFAINRAATAEDIAEAAALFEVPSQNIVFATVDGQIGYQAPGKIPVRRTVRDGSLPSDGTWPRPGWDSRYDWQGFVAPGEMPAIVDPPEGFIVAANQAVIPSGEDPFLTSDWDYGFRSQRIRELLAERIAAGPLEVADMNEIMLDAHSAYADVLVPWLLPITIDNEFDAAGQELLREWDRSMDVDSAAAVYLAAVWQNLLTLTFHDELPSTQWPDGGSRWLEVVRGILEDPRSPWWDDRTTVGVEEGRDEILLRALVSARAELTRRLGKDTADWSWGKLHVAAPEHAVLGGESLPGPIRALVNPRPLGVAGGSSIVNANGWDAADPDGSFHVTWSPSMRMVVDLADLDRSTWVTMTGASGHPGSRHYTDQFTAWAKGETFPWPFSPTAVTRAAQNTLTLRPAS